MRLSDFDFALPDELIAAYPAARRQESRLLVVNRAEGRWYHRRFEDIAEYLNPPDLMVLNDTRVLPARVFGHKPTGGEVELLFLEEQDSHTWTALAKGKKLKPGTEVRVEGHVFELLAKEGDLWRIETGNALPGLLYKVGRLPLPPYIVQRRRQSGESEYWQDDSERYQTVFARQEGAVAAPTAGLHFTPELLAALGQKGVARSEVTLHIGLGTFLPVRTDDPELHKMHSERIELTGEAVKAIADAKQRGGNVVAIGTTVVRALEGAVQQAGALEPFSGATDIFIKPGYRFAVVDRLLTNFHLPKSTLLMLVSAFAGRELMLEAYQEAVKQQYRFFSYGDAMLIL